MRGEVRCVRQFSQFILNVMRVRGYGRLLGSGPGWFVPLWGIQAPGLHSKHLSKEPNWSIIMRYYKGQFYKFYLSLRRINMYESIINLTHSEVNKYEPKSSIVWLCLRYKPFAPLISSVGLLWLAAWPLSAMWLAEAWSCPAAELIRGWSQAPPVTDKLTMDNICGHLWFCLLITFAFWLKGWQ